MTCEIGLGLRPSFMAMLEQRWFAEVDVFDHST